MEQKYSYTLKQAVKDDKGFEITEISIRQATVADYIASEEMGKDCCQAKKNVQLFSILSGLSPKSLEALILNEWLGFLRGANIFLGLDT